MILKEITFEDIFPIWRDFLWANRISDIKPMSSMTFDRNYDLSIYDNYQPYFCGVFDGDILIGVNSCHQTSASDFRSRGIYIFPEYRKQNISKLLFNFVKQKAVEANTKILWSLPRLTALNSYKAFGFEVCSEVINENVEFGPNVYVKYNL